MLREELNEKDTWDLTTIFANNEEFEKAFNNANIEIENIKKYENIMINSSDELYQTTKTIYEVGEKIDRIYTYANLKYSEDTSNNDSQTLIGRAQELYKKFSEATVFYDTKLISLDEETFEKYISENKNLREYERELLIKECEYDLSKVELIIRKYTSKNTSIKRIMKPYIELNNKLNNQSYKNINLKELLK